MEINIVGSILLGFRLNPYPVRITSVNPTYMSVTRTSTARDLAIENPIVGRYFGEKYTL